MKATRKLITLLLLGSMALAGAAQAGNAKDVGQAVVDVYIDTMKDTAAMLADQPPADDVRSAFQARKEESVQKLVDLGRQVAEMSPGDRAVVESAVNSANMRLQYDAELKPVYTAYAAAANHYLSADREFFRELQSINILTQYAFFDLLRKQAPEEAERLGV